MHTTLVWMGLACLVAGCGTNEAGNLGAMGSGDPDLLAERASPLADLVEACGDGSLTDGGDDVIHRVPYLQQVTTDSAMIGWVTTEAPRGEHVTISTPDGVEVMTAAAEPEKTAVRAAGETQMWTHVSGLEPDTIYCYRLASDEEALAQPAGFRTAPAADSGTPVRFVTFGDSGFGGTDQFTLLEQMHTVPFDLILHTGDLAYDSGTIGEIEDTVFQVYDELFAFRPFYPAAGNHDYETLQGAPFRDVFALPGTEKWYSYDWGQVHFAALDTEADYAAQAAWLDADLAASDRPWKVVYMHRPPYSSGEHGSDMKARALFGPVFEKHHVQLVLAGHDHDYERVAPQNGVTYVVTGGGGRGTRSVGHSAFTVHSEAVIHFVYVEIDGDQAVLHAIDATGAEFDSVAIPR